MEVSTGSVQEPRDPSTQLASSHLLSPLMEVSTGSVQEPLQVSAEKSPAEQKKAGSP